MSRFFLRKPTIAQTWQRVQRDRETGILTHAGTLSQTPTREEVETWAMLAGYDPIRYATAWVCQAARAAHPKGSKASGEEKNGQ